MQTEITVKEWKKSPRISLKHEWKWSHSEVSNSLWPHGL